MPVILRKRKPRSGAAMIEFAVCAPVFFLITMGTIESCRMLYLRQSLKIAAYECARVGIMPQINQEVLQDQCDLILSGRKIRGYKLSCVPADINSLRFGDLFTVNIEVPAEENALVGAWFYHAQTLAVSVSIMAEH